MAKGQKRGNRESKKPKQTKEPKDIPKSTLLTKEMLAPLGSAKRTK